MHPKREMAACLYQNGDVRLYFPVSRLRESPYVHLGGVATQASGMSFSSDGRYLTVDTYTRAVITVALRQHLAPVYVPPVKKTAPVVAGDPAAGQDQQPVEVAPAAA